MCFPLLCFVLEIDAKFTDDFWWSHSLLGGMIMGMAPWGDCQRRLLFSHMTMHQIGVKYDIGFYAVLFKVYTPKANLPRPGSATF